MRRLPNLAAVLVSACLVAAGCGSKSHQPTHSADNGTFTFAIPGDPGAFDPYHNSKVMTYSSLAYDSLVNRRPDGRFVSGIAERWTADANSAIFTLRKDVTCSDGTPSSATDVASAINYVSNPANGSPRYGVQTPTVPLTATGNDADRSVKVEPKSPFGFLLNTIGQLPIVCAKGLKNSKTLASASDGTGPFVLTTVVPGQSYTFRRRDNYTWGPAGTDTHAPGTPETVVLRVVANEATAANLLLSGEVNMASISGEDQQRLKAPGITKDESPAAGAWLWFNQISGHVTEDKNVRQALVHALNLAEVIRVNTGGRGGPATGLIAREPKSCPGDTISGQLPKLDVPAAEALLGRAGWSMRPDGIRSKHGTPLAIDLHYLPGGRPLDKPTAELIADRWRAVGVKVTVTADTSATFAQVMWKTSNYDVHLIGFDLDLPSQIAQYVSGPLPPKGTNVAGIDNPEYNALVAKANAMTPPKACTFWNQAEQALWRDIDPIPVSYRPWSFYQHGAKAEVNALQWPIPTSIKVLN